MSVFGIDLGNLYSSVSLARRGGIDVILNEVSKRETSSYVSFGNVAEGRMAGEKGADMKVRNFKNTVNNMKRLVGVKAGSEEWKKEEQFCFFRTTEDKEGYICAEVQFDGETQVFRPEQVIAILLQKLNQYADREANLDAHAKALHLVDFVLSCPPYYSAFQRKLLLQAAEMAALKCLTLVTEGTAVALAWGIFQQLPEKEEEGKVVQFVDFGHSATYVTTCKFWKGNMKVLSHVYDKHLGCRDFDMALADHFRTEIQGKYKMDVYEQKKAKLRLLAGCEKLRYTLSANPVVSLNVECIMDDVDVSFSNYQRDHFYEISDKLWERMSALVALAKKQPEADKVELIELVGGGSYMPKVREILKEAYGKEVMSTMNVSEAVTKGCGLIGAILSPRMRVEFQVQDALSNTIMVGYHSSLATTPSPVTFIPSINKESTLYVQNCSFPKVFDLSFDRKETFDLHTYYKEPCDEVLAANGSLLLGHWRFSGLPPFRNLQGEVEEDKNVRVAVRFRLNSSGFVTVEAAFVNEEYEEEKEVEVVKKPEEKKDEKEEKKKDSKKDKKEAKKEEKKEKEEEKTTEIIKKKKTRRIDIDVETLFIHGFSSLQVEELAKAEAKMMHADRMLEETQDAKNAVEAYSYEFRSKAEEGGVLFEYMTEEVRVAFRKACDDAVDWVYGEGEDVDCEQYKKKLAELRAEGDRAVQRRKLREELPFVIQETDRLVLAQLGEANRLLVGETHIEKEKLEEIVKKGTEARAALKKDRESLEAAAKDVDITLTEFGIRLQATAVEAFAKPIFATPKPTPPPAEEPKAEDAKAEEAGSPKAETKSEAGSPKADAEPKEAGSPKPADGPGAGMEVD